MRLGDSDPKMGRVGGRERKRLFPGVLFEDPFLPQALNMLGAVSGLRTRVLSRKGVLAKLVKGSAPGWRVGCHLQPNLWPTPTPAVAARACGACWG